MSERLENFIRKQRKEFDESEPPADLWNKIESRLDETKKTAFNPHRTVRLSFILSIAAALIIVLTAGIVFLRHQRKEMLNISNINPELAKQQVLYASLIKTKQNELKQIEKDDPRLYTEFSSEIRKMEAGYLKLKNDLPTSPNQEETVKAMIINLKTQIQVLNQQLTVIQQINQIKHEHTDDTHSI